MFDPHIILKRIASKFALRGASGSSRQSGVLPGESFRYIAQTVYLTPLLVGLATAFLFAAVPQMQEIYLALIEEADYGRGLAGLAAVSLFCAFLYAWNHVEVTARIDAIYPAHADLAFDRRVFEVRDLKSAFAASLPFFGILAGLAEVYRHVLDASETGLARGALRSLAALPGGVAAAVAITLAVYFVLLALLCRYRKPVVHHYGLLRFCYGLTAILILVPLIAPGLTVSSSRFAGPLAVTALVLLQLAVLLRLLFWLSRRVFNLVLALPSRLLMATGRLPFGARQAAIALAPLAVLAVIAFGVVRTGDSGSGAQTEENAAVRQGGDLTPILQTWLSERKSGQGRYPVFVVAAQGGGIYAASTTSAFLAAMQDHCPAFARHVFAISAVSGGSVGASLFNAAFADSIARGTNRKASVDVEPGCDSLFAKPGELSRRLRAITQDDHISPVVASLVPDLVRGLFPGRLHAETEDGANAAPCAGGGFASGGGRDRVLEKSFVDSFIRTGPSPKDAAKGCADQNVGNLLGRSFSASWSQKGDLPALLLNATWVETGYRVAFAPFSLQAFGSGTLYSFDAFSGSKTDPSLIRASLISARFPGIMPPWTLGLEEGRRLTFVDGGYADSSGVTTAIQLYNKLNEVGGGDIDLYLIVLTDKSRALTPAMEIEPAGSAPVRSWLYDVAAPFTTLLSMRDLQSRKAVTEARTQLGEKMIVVQLDQKAFPLPLGWKLSGLSSDIIRLMIGDPGRCGTVKDKADTASAIANRNSCELKRVVELITPKTAPAPSSPAGAPLESASYRFGVESVKPYAVLPKPDASGWALWGGDAKPENQKIEAKAPKSLAIPPKPEHSRTASEGARPDVASTKPAPKTLGAWAPQ